MVTWEEFKSEFEAGRREKREKRETQKPEDGVKSKKEGPDQKEKILLEERARIEDERWGTPERAYKTWEERAGELFGIANEHILLFNNEIEQVRQRYKDKNFDVHIPRTHFKSIFGEYKIVGNVSPLEFSCIDSHSSKEYGFGYSAPGHKYQPARNRWVTYLNKQIGTPSGNGDLVDSEGFDKAIREFLEPFIKIERIEKGYAPIAKAYLEFLKRKDSLLKERRRNYKCAYETAIKVGGIHESLPLELSVDDIEDVYTEFGLGTSASWTALARIFNPFHKNKKWFMEMAHDGFELVTHYKSHESHSRSW